MRHGTTSGRASIVPARSLRWSVKTACILYKYTYPCRRAPCETRGPPCLLRFRWNWDTPLE
jgi:hypothetical protein